MMETWIALYILALAGFTGYEVISRVPVTLHTPLMSGTNFIHGIVLVGNMAVLGRAETDADLIVAALGLCLATLNVVGGFAVTDRMLEMFRKRS